MKNRIRIDGDVIIFKPPNSDQEFIFDNTKEIYELLLSYNWRVNNQGYLYTKHKVLIHRVILSAPPSMQMVMLETTGNVTYA